MRMSLSTVILLLLVGSLCLPVRGDDLIFKDGARKEVIVQEFSERTPGLKHVTYWTLKLWGSSAVNLSRGQPEEVYDGQTYGEFEVELRPGDVNRIRDKWKRAGLSLNIELRSGRHFELNNCDLEWDVPKGYIATSIDGRPVSAKYGPSKEWPYNKLPLKSGEKSFGDIERIRFEDDGSLTVTPRDGKSYPDSFNAKVKTLDGPKDLAPKLVGFIYAEDGALNSSAPKKPYFLSVSTPLEEVREIVVPADAIPRAGAIPRVLSYTFNQPVRGSAPIKVTGSGGTTKVTPDSYRGFGINVSFSGDVQGVGFNGDVQIFFCEGLSLAAQPSARDDSTCRQAKGSVEVRSPNSLGLTNIALPAGDWRLYVKTEYGRSYFSDRFSVY